MKQQLNKYLRVYLIITVIITNAFINVNFVIAAGTQTNSLDKGLIAHFPLNRAAKQSSTKFADTSPYARIGTITAGASAGLSKRAWPAELMILTEPIPKLLLTGLQIQNFKMALLSLFGLNPIVWVKTNREELLIKVTVVSQ
ncbi:MAG: hypothetical protein NTZ18_03160 [Candidatus Komeilibacteria bacterium]|nr:hypothetical protein [Candidatus Komeilibacteria bacterium]